MDITPGRAELPLPSHLQRLRENRGPEVRRLHRERPGRRQDIAVQHLLEDRETIRSRTIYSRKTSEPWANMIRRCLYTALFVLHAGTATSLPGRTITPWPGRSGSCVRFFPKSAILTRPRKRQRLRFGDKRSGAGPDYDFFIDINYFLGGQYRSVARNITGRPVLPDFRSRILLSQSYLRLGMNSRSLGAVRGIGYDAVEAPLQVHAPCPQG